MAQEINNEEDMAQIKQAVGGQPQASQSAGQPPTIQQPDDVTSALPKTPQRTNYQNQQPIQQSPAQQPNQYQPMTQEVAATPMPKQTSTREMEGMSPSMMSEGYEEQIEPPSPQAPSPEQDYPNYEEPYQEQYAEPQAGGYSEYEEPYREPYYNTGTSPELISELAEQIFEEKLSPLKSKFNKALTSQTTIETKIKNIQSRIERMEKIMDNLQLQILQKVGQYINDVSNLKSELIETQKTIRATKKSPKKK